MQILPWKNWGFWGDQVRAAPRSTGSANRAGDTALHVAAGKNNVDAMLELLGGCAAERALTEEQVIVRALFLFKWRFFRWKLMNLKNDEFLWRQIAAEKEAEAEAALMVAIHSNIIQILCFILKSMNVV